MIRKHQIIFRADEDNTLPHLVFDVLEETRFGSIHCATYVDTDDVLGAIAMLDEHHLEDFESEEAISATVMELVAAAHTYVNDRGAAQAPYGWHIVE